jgi:hypothetical protein
MIPARDLVRSTGGAGRPLLTEDQWHRCSSIWNMDGEADWRSHAKRHHVVDT